MNRGANFSPIHLFRYYCIFLGSRNNNGTFPLALSKVIIVAELYHGTTPREAVTLHPGTNVKLLTLPLFPSFLQNHLWRKKRLWNPSHQAHPKTLPRKSLKTGWTVWFPNEKEKEKTCLACKAGPMAALESSWFTSLPRASVFHQLTQCTPTSVFDNSHSNTFMRLGAFFSDLVISHSGRAEMRLFPAQQVLLLLKRREQATGHAFGQINQCWSVECFSFLWRGLGVLFVSCPFPSSHSVVVESSRGGALQEAKPRIGTYHFIAVGTSFYLRFT